jgi:hypothetical protein
MLIPVNPSRALVRASKRKAQRADRDVHLEVIPPRDGQVAKVGRAKVTGRTEAINRRGP